MQSELHCGKVQFIPDSLVLKVPSIKAINTFRFILELTLQNQRSFDRSITDDQFRGRKTT